MICTEAVKFMHDHLDGDLLEEKYLQLQAHLDICNPCRERYVQLHKMLAVIQYDPNESASQHSSDDLCQKIMRSLPKTRWLKRMFAWIRLHPKQSIASLCGLFLVSVWAMSFDVDTKLMVKIPNQDRAIISGNHVVIPNHTIIHGDVFVGNGVIDVHGQIDGDLVVMNGDYSLAKTAEIQGEIHHIRYSYERWMIQLQNWFD